MLFKKEPLGKKKKKKKEPLEIDTNEFMREPVCFKIMQYVCVLKMGAGHREFLYTILTIIVYFKFFH